MDVSQGMKEEVCIRCVDRYSRMGRIRLLHGPDIKIASSVARAFVRRPAVLELQAKFLGEW